MDGLACDMCVKNACNVLTYILQCYIHAILRLNCV